VAASPCTTSRSITTAGGECYFRDGWSKFFVDYGVHEGWFILLTRQYKKDDFTLCLFDGTLSARAFAAQP
jgi:hypothetical protein